MFGQPDLVVEQRHYSRGDYLTMELVRALAPRRGYSYGEIVSQNAVQVWCTKAQWVDLLKEASAARSGGHVMVQKADRNLARVVQETLTFLNGPQDAVRGWNCRRARADCEYIFP